LGAHYLTQYQLVIKNNAPAKASGAGWYDAGSLASYSIATAQYRTGGVLDLLGAKGTFQGWFEDGRLISSSGSGSIEMVGPHTITAEWRIDYTIPIIIVALVGAGFGSTAYLSSRRPGGGRKHLKGRRSKPLVD
jgi:hypothetical protein